MSKDRMNQASRGGLMTRLRSNMGKRQGRGQAVKGAAETAQDSGGQNDRNVRQAEYNASPEGQRTQALIDDAMSGRSMQRQPGRPPTAPDSGGSIDPEESQRMIDDAMSGRSLQQGQGGQQRRRPNRLRERMMARR